MPTAISLARLVAAPLALFCVLVALSATPALAQGGEPEFYDTPYAYGQWNLGRRLNDTKLLFCVDKRDPDAEVATAIAEAIAGALLLEPELYSVESGYEIEDFTRVYALLLEHCDIHMGFKLIPDGYPEWVTVTRAYYQTQYSFVTTDPSLQRLGDLPPGRPIGATIGTSAHLRLVAYLTSLPAAQRWRVFPFGTSDQTLRALLEGTVDIALTWAPDIWARTRSDAGSANLRIVDSAPLPPETLGVGAIMLQHNTYLRVALDEAIGELLADGTIQSIIDQYEFPAATPR